MKKKIIQEKDGGGSDLLFHFLSDPGVPGVRSMGPDVRPSVRPSVSTRLFADLTDVTLADEDSNSIPPDDVNSAI